MKFRFVPVTFLGLAVLHGVNTVGAAEVFWTHSSGRLGLLALHAALGTAIALTFAIFTAQRSEPYRRAREPIAFLACALAIVAVAPAAGPHSSTSSALLLGGDAVAVCGSLWIFASALALGRCFGVLPEARGLVTRGPYRLVRHPLYLGEIGAMTGLTLAAPATSHLVILAVFILAQSARMGLEERALQDAFPEYAAYAARTPRIVPAARIASRASMSMLAIVWRGSQAGLARSHAARWLASIFSAAFAVIMVIGCGSSDPPPARAPLTSITPSRAHAVAPLLTIRRADLPEFKVSAQAAAREPEDFLRNDQRFARCVGTSHVSTAQDPQVSVATEARSDNAKPQRPWASASSQRLSANSGYQTLGATSEVWIMPTSGDARREIAFAKNIGLGCLGRALRAEAASKRERLPVQGVVVQPLSMAVKAADNSVAYRTVVAYRGVPLVFYIDSVVFSYGQDAFTLTTFHASKPVPLAMDDRLLGLLIARARSHSR